MQEKHGLVLNKKKCEVKSNSVKFFGCVYDKHGVHPDPSKVSTIKEMPAPQNKGELQSFLGMVTYLSPFIPQLSSHTATLRGLLKTDVKYCWNATYQVAFDKLKSLVCEGHNTEVLQHEETSGQSKLMHLARDWEPHSSRMMVQSPSLPKHSHPQSSTMPTNNERELLTCVFGAEHFRTYVFW